MFKDEAGGLIISEFVGLRAKLYSFKNTKDSCRNIRRKEMQGS